MSIKLNVKRVYDPPARTDGFRVLVDRLWPRGVTKIAAKIDLWDQTIPPSTALRKWFHADAEHRFDAFAKKYERELARSKALENLKGLIRNKKIVTLVTGAKNVEHSHIPIILRQLL